MFLSVALASCKDDEKEPENVDKNEIVGTWQLTEIAPEDASTSIPELELLESLISCIYQLKLTFASNNTLTPSDCDAATLAIGGYFPMSTGTTWKVENGILTLTSGTTTESLPIQQNGDNMSVTVNAGTSGQVRNAVLKFKRV